MSDIYDDLAKQLNVPADKIKAALESEEAAGNLIITQQGDAISNGKIGAQRILDYFDNKIPFSELGQAVGMVFDGVAAKESIAELPPDKVPTRPKGSGLSEAMTAAIATNKQYPAEMYNAKLDSGKLGALQTVIDGRREMEKEVSSFSTLLGDDLAVYERSAADMLATGYGKVRDKALSDRKLGDSLADVEDYLYGPAKQAATSRARGLRTRTALTSQLPQSIYVQGQQQGRKDAIQQLTALLADPPQGTDGGQGGSGSAGTGSTSSTGTSSSTAEPAKTAHHTAQSGTSAKRHK